MGVVCHAAASICAPTAEAVGHQFTSRALSCIDPGMRGMGDPREAERASGVTAELAIALAPRPPSPK